MLAFGTNVVGAGHGHPLGSCKGGLRRLVGSGLLGLVVLGTSAPAGAVTIQVGDDCTVAQALESAETDAAVAGCSAGSGDDEILVPAGSEEVWVAAPVELTSSVTLRAVGGRATIRRDILAPYFGLLTLSGSAALTLEDLSLRDGVSDGLAGCIDVGASATLTARRVLFDSCGTSPTSTASLPAGSIHTAGTTLLDSCLVLNTSVNSTDPGAVRVVNGVTTLVNTTITGSSGSGIRQWNGLLELTHVTLAGNTGYDLRVRGDRVTNARNSVIETLEGTLTEDDSNVVNASALLATLTDNGGPTATLAPLQGSPVLDAANDVVCEGLDQRGVERPSGDHCDVGSFEHIVVCDDGFLHPSEDCDGDQFQPEWASCPPGYDGTPVCGETCQLGDPPAGCTLPVSSAGAGGQPGEAGGAGGDTDSPSAGSPNGGVAGSDDGVPEAGAGFDAGAGGETEAPTEHARRRWGGGDCDCRLPVEDEGAGAQVWALAALGLAGLRRSRRPAKRRLSRPRAE